MGEINYETETAKARSIRAHGHRRKTDWNNAHDSLRQVRVEDVCVNQIRLSARLPLPVSKPHEPALLETVIKTTQTPFP
jgi:hypothetical protein